MRRRLLLASCSLLFALAHCGSDSADPPAQGGPGGAAGAAGGSSSAGSSGIAGAAGATTSACPATTGPGVEHKSTISSDETWKAEDGPHLVTFTINVATGATLTIEPCAEVRIQNGYSITVEGSLKAQGSAEQPVTIVPDDNATPWGALQVFAPGTLSLAHATVRGGGAETSSTFAMIEARGDQLAPAQKILKLDHVRLEGSAAYGVSLRAGAAFTEDSQELTITGSKRAAMRILPRLATNIPTGGYTGNAEDAIVVETEAYGEIAYEDVTYHDRGVPYRIGGDMSLGELRVGPKPFKLTMEPGVRFLFKQGGALRAVDDGATTGLIHAVGTAEKPILFDSATSSVTAGDWVGIQLGKVPGAFAFEHIEIRHAGGPSGANGFHCQPNPEVAGAQSKNEDAALTIFHQPPSSYLSLSLIADSAGDGVNNAYTGAFIDVKPTNTFANVAGCEVTLPLPTQGLCPSQGCP